MILQVGVKAFLRNSEGKYLLLKRNVNTYPSTKGVWDIVGGRIEPGSGLIDNLKREIHEETQLNVVGNPLLLFAQDIILDEGRHIVRLTYCAECSGDVVLDRSEHTEYKWMDLHEIKLLNDLDIYTKEIIDTNILYEKQ